MAKAAFRVEDGIIPGHTNADLGHTQFKFRDIHMSRNTHIDGDANVGGDLDVTGSTTMVNLSATGSTIFQTSMEEVAVAVVYLLLRQ